MPTPQFFFAQPQFRASASALSLALASEYYRFDIFAAAEDRDIHCGPTAHPDVRYVRATMEDIVQNDVTLDDIGCGVSLDHPGAPSAKRRAAATSRSRSGSMARRRSVAFRRALRSAGFITGQRGESSIFPRATLQNTCWRSTARTSVQTATCTSGHLLPARCARSSSTLCRASAWRAERWAPLHRTKLSSARTSRAAASCSAFRPADGGSPAFHGRMLYSAYEPRTVNRRSNLALTHF
jgi:hypothetical protein